MRNTIVKKTTYVFLMYSKVFGLFYLPPFLGDSYYYQRPTMYSNTAKQA